MVKEFFFLNKWLTSCKMSKWQKFTIPTYYAMSCYTINNTIIMENEKEIQREKENLASHTQRNKQIRINKIDISTKKKK